MEALLGAEDDPPEALGTEAPAESGPPNTRPQVAEAVGPIAVACANGWTSSSNSQDCIARASAS